MNDYKTCTKCGQTKTLLDFHKVSPTSDKFRSYCKVCNNQASKNYRINNPGKVQELTKIWKANNPDVVASMRKRWKQENPEKVLASNKRYYEKNRKQFAEMAKIWRAKNPEKVTEFKAAHRARKKAAPTYFITNKEKWKLRNDPCFYCGQPAKHLDHIIPLSRGGNHSIGNLAPACVRCNTSKNDKTIMEWRIWQRKMNRNV